MKLYPLMDESESDEGKPLNEEGDIDSLPRPLGAPSPFTPYPKKQKLKSNLTSNCSTGKLCFLKFIKMYN